MPYISPVTDRTLEDILALNSKAYMNVADWDRIEDNSIFVRDELVTYSGIVIVFTGTTSAPTITTIPDVGTFNQLLENIEFLRQAALSVIPTLGTTPGFSVVAYDWVAGASDVFDFTDVNLWERVMDLIHSTIAAETSLRFRYARTGIAMANSGLTWNNRFR